MKVRHEVTAIHPERKTVSVQNLATGEEFEESYDKLLLSPGAKPTQPRLPGVGLDRVFTLRTVEDTFRIKAYISAHRPGSAGAPCGPAFSPPRRRSRMGRSPAPRACPLQQPVQGAGTGAQPPAAEPPKRPEAACPSRLLCKLPKPFPGICPPARQTVPLLRTIPGLSRSLFVTYLQIITPPIAESKQNSPSAIPLFCQNRPINA